MNKHRTYRVKSTGRLISFVVIMIIFTVTGINTILGNNNVSGQDQQKYVTVTVESGDTIWDLAQRYMPDDMDKRKAVYIVSKFNKLESSSLTPGQIIYIPTNHLE